MTKQETQIHYQLCRFLRTDLLIQGLDFSVILDASVVDSKHWAVVQLQKLSPGGGYCHIWAI